VKAPAPTLRAVCRGDEPDELLLVGSDHRVVILKDYGLTLDEAIRTREVAFTLLGGTHETREVAP
jgi:hypothetical protein